MTVTLRATPEPSWYPVLEFDSRMQIAPSHDPASYTVALIGGRNWSFKDLYTQADAKADPQFADAVGKELWTRGIRTAYSPSMAAMSGRVVSMAELSTEILLPYDVKLYRNADVKADSVPLRRREAFTGGFGGCAVIVVSGGGLLYAAHGGRDSLIDRNRINGTSEQREFASIVDAIAADAKRCSVHPSMLTLRCFFSIPPERFGHSFRDEHYGEYNLRLADFLLHDYGESAAQIKEGAVYPNLAGIVRAQAEHIGMCTAHVPELEVLPLDGPFPDTRDADAAVRNQRSLVIVHRLT